MGDMEVRTTIMISLLNASTVAQQRDDPNAAVINVQALNKMLPRKFRADLDEHRPTEPARNTHDKVFMRQALNHKKRMWQYYGIALELVVEKVS